MSDAAFGGSASGRDPAREADPERLARLRARIAMAIARACPAWLAADRDDLVQNAMLKVMRIERDREGNEEFSSSYLHRVAFSAVVDEMRLRRRRSEVPLDSDEGSDVQDIRNANPEHEMRAREIGSGMRACLAAMSGDRRVALTLRLLGHTVPEAASRLGWEGKRVENLVYRGLADLRACLERKGLKP
jgi:RNA polymerase sigma-70 factor (ECF subfamily)